MSGASGSGPRQSPRDGILPHPMEDDCQLAGDRNRGLLVADLFDQPGAPGFERRPPRDAVQDEPCCLEQQFESSFKAPARTVHSG